jgi:DNA gyrase/topoisomerase IV subunit B
MKREVDTLVATPEKRIFLSIIADYDLNRSICELVDNAIDVWVRGSRKSNVVIKINLDKAQQTITVEDNAGGLPKSDLRFVVGPGHTGNATTDETIGMFGVGTKRAVVALSQDITISTRHGRDKTYQIEIDDSWLAQEDWSLPVYEVDEIGRGSTVVSLQRLRLSP